VAAPTREKLIDLVDMHHDRSAFDRARTLAWTQGQVQLRHLDIGTEEAADFQRLAAAIFYSDPCWRPSPAAILRGAGPQSELWRHGISGDLPIVLLRIDDVGDIAQVRQLLRAHEYWRMKRLAVDLVIVNEHPSSYIQDLQTAIETAVRSSESRPRFGRELAQGTAHVLRADLMDCKARELLSAVARVVLCARNGPSPRSSRSNRRRTAEILRKTPVPRSERTIPAAAPEPADLEFFNGLGGFDKDGREYVTILENGATTPAPWINVVANAGFGFQASPKAAASPGPRTAARTSSRRGRTTPWSIRPAKPSTSGTRRAATLWTPTAQPIRDDGRYVARHGFGYSRFEHTAHGIAADLLQYVPLADPIKISRLTLRNLSGRPRRLSVTSYAEWVLGTSRGASAPFLATEIDSVTGALLARNPWGTAFPGRVAFADLCGGQTTWTGDRGEFIGRGGHLGAPAALTRRGAAVRHDRHGARSLRCPVPDAGARARRKRRDRRLPRPMRLARGRPGSRRALPRHRPRCRPRRRLRPLARGARGVQVRTPDRAMDIMLNGWLLYQTIACRIRARAAFYQASGAYGFRDQLQDGMALSFAQPEETRAHLLRVAGRQFVEGDVQHWWLPHQDRACAPGSPTTASGSPMPPQPMSAQRATPPCWTRACRSSKARPSRPGEHDAFFQPMEAEASASLFEHCARGLDQCLELTGAHGLPLIGTGDWNDGMNRVGEGGEGESVWLGWLLLRTIAIFAPLADARDPDRARRWRAHAEALRTAQESAAWDGGWYRRATFDDGTWLGSSHSDECRIDSIAQSWAVLSRAADPSRAAQAMAALESQLIRRDEGLALLFTPPFDKTPRDPGYIKGYPPGCARTAASTATPPCGRSSPSPNSATATGPPASSRSSTRSTTPGRPQKRSATRWSLTSWRPTSTPSRPMSDAAAGPGTPVRPAGCTAPASKGSLACAVRAGRADGGQGIYARRPLEEMKSKGRLERRKPTLHSRLVTPSARAAARVLPCPAVAARYGRSFQFSTAAPPVPRRNGSCRIAAPFRNPAGSRRGRTGSACSRARSPARSEAAAAADARGCASACGAPPRPGPAARPRPSPARPRARPGPLLHPRAEG
jgi:cyclic beta-1,2-glucan synthetase